MLTKFREFRVRIANPQTLEIAPHITLNECATCGALLRNSEDIRHKHAEYHKG